MSGDFAGLHSGAYGPWAAAHVRANDRPKSILRKHNYHYTWGISSRFGAGITLPPLDLQTSLAIGRYASIEGLDRSQEELTVDPEGSERHLELDASLGFNVPSTPVRLGVGWATNERISRIERIVVERTLHTWSTSVGLQL
jgi:hypothetical protein